MRVRVLKLQRCRCVRVYVSEVKCVRFRLISTCPVIDFGMRIAIYTLAAPMYSCIRDAHPVSTSRAETHHHHHHVSLDSQVMFSSAVWFTFRQYASFRTPLGLDTLMFSA